MLLLPPRRPRPWVLLSLLLSLAVAPLARGADAPPADALEKQVRAILESNCFRCHSHQAGKSKGGLMLDSHAAQLKGGDGGPAVVAGDAEKSLLLKAVRYADENLKMPPKGKLPDADIAILQDWIKAGAPWTG